MKPGEFITTPNGPARLQARTWVGEYPIGTPPNAVLVRHPKGADIDTSKCADVISATGRDGWLVAYYLTPEIEAMK